MSKAAKLVLDGNIQATVHSMKKIIEFWALILTTPLREIESQLGQIQENLGLRCITALITCREIHKVMKLL